MTEPITKVLVANRGEIALRIVRTLRVMNIAAVVVHHELDADSPAVREADEAYELLGDPPVSAYLDIPALVEACLETGARAVHPGYGFLSENAQFPRALAEAGIGFIGPRPEVIELMGDKIAARAFAVKHGVPVAPSLEGDPSAPDFAERAAAIGFPLMVKAAAGGGGKGMHIVRSADELAARLESARRENERYFGDGRVYCEKYLERSRHIEVQILADEHGNCIHLGERECSVQRRFQKIIEESPSPALGPELREAICGTAVRLASAAGYTGAGTVEFILGQGGEFYFLEMNTRLQVEHPVTECVTGMDLVAEQLRVAMGQPLAVTQQDIRPSGHAIECRIYAEDPDEGFIPSTGRLEVVHAHPAPGVRVDSGVAEGSVVSPAFDPMLAKVIAHGGDRAQAIARCARALKDSVFLGVSTNLAYLGRILAHEAFHNGAMHTASLEELSQELSRPPLDEATRNAVLAAAALMVRRLHPMEEIPEPYASMGAWRN